MMKRFESAFLIILAIIFGLLLCWPVLHNLASENDFDLFILAAEKFKNYEPVYQDSIIHGRYFYYSPLFLTLLQPFLWFHEISTSVDSVFLGYRLSFVLAKASWSLFNLYIISYFVKEVSERFKFESEKIKHAFWILALYLGYRWLFLNLWHSQLTLFVLWGIYHATMRKHENLVLNWWSFSVAAQVKILPLFWLPKLLLEKKWEALAFISASIILLILLPMFFIPMDYLFTQTFDWLERVNPLKSQHVLTTGEGGFIDLASLVVKYFTQQRLSNEPYVSVANVNVRGVFWISQLVRLVFFMAIMLLYQKVKRSKVFQADFLVFSLFSMGIPLIFPHQRDYSLALLLPSLMYLIYLFVNPNYTINSILSGLLLVSLLLMGNAIFFEMFSYDFRVWLIGVRLQGLGAIIYFWCFFLVILDYLKNQTEIQ